MKYESAEIMCFTDTYISELVHCGPYDSYILILLNCICIKLKEYSMGHFLKDIRVTKH